jgi:hypothetical protein
MWENFNSCLTFDQLMEDGRVHPIPISFSGHGPGCFYTAGRRRCGRYVLESRCPLEDNQRSNVEAWVTMHRLSEQHSAQEARWLGSSELYILVPAAVNRTEPDISISMIELDPNRWIDCRVRVVHLVLHGECQCQISRDYGSGSTLKEVWRPGWW